MSLFSIALSPNGRVCALHTGKNKPKYWNLEQRNVYCKAVGGAGQPVYPKAQTH